MESANVFTNVQLRFDIGNSMYIRTCTIAIGITAYMKLNVTMNRDVEYGRCNEGEVNP